MNQETRVGLFTLMGAAVFAGGIFVLGDINVKTRYPLHVLFNSAEGLPDKGPVKVAGVEVGKVEKIMLEGQRARVTVRLDRSVEVHADAKATIASTGLIGSKYLDLTLGSDAAPVLKEGAMIEGEPTVSMEDMMKKLSDLFVDDPVNGSAMENLRATMAHMRNVSESLDAAMGQQRQEMIEIVRNVRGLTANIKSVSANLDEILAEHKDDVKVTLEKIRSISERMDDVMARIQNGKGMVGRLVSDEEMGDDLKQTMTSVKEASGGVQKFFKRVSQIETWWDYRQRYDFEDDQWRADLGLRIQPRPGRYYFIQGNNLGEREDRDVPGTDVERKNTITAVMGKDFGPFTLYGGAIRSSGGAGVRFRPLPGQLSRRFELEAEGFNFGRDEVIHGHHYDGPVYNYGARVLVKDPWLYVGGQVEDAAERKNFNANVNLTFRDEDIAYLLGLVGLAR